MIRAYLCNVEIKFFCFSFHFRNSQIAHRTTVCQQAVLLTLLQHQMSLLSFHLLSAIIQCHLQDHLLIIVLMDQCFSNLYPISSLGLHELLELPQCNKSDPLRSTMLLTMASPLRIGLVSILCFFIIMLLARLEAAKMFWTNFLQLLMFYNNENTTIFIVRQDHQKLFVS